jgi:hypothetical protein
MPIVMQRILTMVFIGLAACGGPKGSGPEGGDEVTTETTGDTNGVPIECEGVEDAANSPACLEALTAICREPGAGSASRCSR